MTTVDNSLLVRKAPQNLQIEVTSRCNLKCKMCPLTTGSTLSSSSPDDLTDVVWQHILPLAKRYGAVSLTGYGEPFLNRDFLSFLKELNQANVHIGMSTNGTLLSKSMAYEIASLEYISHINFSIDSPEENSYRSIRGGNVEKALSGLRNYMAVTKYPNRVTVSSVLMAENIKDLVRFPPILAEIGVKKFYLQGLVDQNASCPEEQLYHKPELYECLDEIHQRCKELGIEVTMPLVERLELERNNPKEALRYFDTRAIESGETKQCTVPWEIPFIDREGRVFPCCQASRDSSAIMGNLQHESWEEIWNGQRFREFRKRLLSGGAGVPPICQGCNSVPRGKHPLLYAAKIMPQKSRLSGKRRMKLVVKNIGQYTWTQDDPIRIGTSSPRDRQSQLRHPTWISANRAASFKEKQVPPGGLATFKFAVNPKACPGAELFELVYENKTWMHNTEFTVNIVAPWWRRKASKLL